ncbi:hypothetical protein O181_027081 [Austropuccinia psidii MF-1]|uniref:Uncharacterized protein n=1 Tax=Austropuccinia psidii MF-1 TaxID=1389203 RepID=A0A9Q3CLM8_9BASI|nr:hypothetical protein [Austropuccinia psidii MF-1]
MVHFSANYPFETHIGLRKTEKRLERQKKSQIQEFKKNFAIPGAYIKGEKEEEIIIILSKFQNSNPPRNVQLEEGVERVSNKEEYEEKKLSKPLRKLEEQKLEIDKMIKRIMQKISTSPLKKFSEFHLILFDQPIKLWWISKKEYMDVYSRSNTKRKFRFSGNHELSEEETIKELEEELNFI